MQKTLSIILLTLAMGCIAEESNTQITPETKIDGSTKESTNVSLKGMLSALPNKQRCLLQASVMRIRIGDPALLEANKFGETVNGLTASQVMALSEQYPAKVTALCKD